ncbi:hypothetical protein [Amycolatopsis antarctica]|uniref:hypothetical protein n=1 Tax=Amycolatopsis antarctica TaxID=1854586 RepID=UPI0010557303|nr:hypothetical protein [Amycolatopsis antarctica]
MRRNPAAIGGTLLLLSLTFLSLTGCGSEAGPKTAQPMQDPGPASMAERIDLQMNDPCFLRPEEQHAPGCAKYVTQLGSVPGGAQKYAGTTQPELVEAGRRLDAAIAAYRNRGCAETDAPDCGSALTDVAATLTEVDAKLVSVLPAGG